MSTGIIIAAVVILLILIIGGFFIGTYNGFIKLKNQVEEAFATMDVYLKKRWDLIPNLVNTVKGYAEHEKSTLEAVTAMRRQSYDGMSAEEKIEANKVLGAGIGRLLATAEQYPDLKASENFSALSRELSSIENEIANSRKYYNAIVRDFNTKTETFPSNIIAGMFHFTRRPMFEVENVEERQNVKVEF